MNQQCQSIQEKLLLYVESEINGSLELADHEMAVVKEHISTCEHCCHEKEAIERNVTRLLSVSAANPSTSLAARCLPNPATQQQRPYSMVYRTAGSMMIVFVLIAMGYFAGVMHQQSTITTSSQPVAMNVLFQQQNDLIDSLEQQIQQNNINLQTTNGVTLVGLKQSAYVMQHIYQSNSRDVVVSESIRQLTEQNVQLLKSLTHYIDEINEDNAIPMQEI